MAAVVDQPKRGDDDEAAPPEVTVPPWLRTGPTPEVPVSTPSPVNDSAARPGDAAGERAESGRQGPSRGAAPNRIRLGAGRRSHAAGHVPGHVPDDVPAGIAGNGPAGAASLTLRTGQPGSAQQSGAVHGPATPPSRDAHTTQTTQTTQTSRSTRARRIVLVAAAGAAVLGGSAVLGFVITRGVVAPAAEQTAGCAAVSEPGRVAGNGPGSLGSPLETVLAFDHAYYVERSAEKAFAAVAPSSRITEGQLRSDGIERVPEGTAHCVEARELSPTLLEVTLTETPPDSEPVVIRQRVRVAESPDGSWGIVSITPAG